MCQLKNIFSCVALAALLVGFIVNPVLAVPPPPPEEVTITMEGFQSDSDDFGDADGTIPAVAGANIQYLYTINSGQVLSFYHPVEICLSEVTNNDAVDWSFDYGFTANSTGGDGSDITIDPSGPQAFTKDAGFECKDFTLRINRSFTNDTGSPVEIVYDINGGVSNKDPNTGGNFKINEPNPKKVQLIITVNPPEPVSTVCFLTDSEGQFLQDCFGALVNVSGDTEMARFAIVTNKKGIQVATNPGQVYYNVLWTNTTGSTKIVNVEFLRTGLVPQGAQAIHAKLFNPAITDVASVTPEMFEEVNDAIPAGQGDAINGVEVPDGWTLWVDYHLVFDGLGLLIDPYTAAECESANEEISVSATISDAGTDAQLGECTSDALGYRKK